MDGIVVGHLALLAENPCIGWVLVTLASPRGHALDAGASHYLPRWQPRTPTGWLRVALVTVALLAVVLGIIARAMAGTQQANALVGHSAPGFSLPSEAHGQLLPGQTSLADTHGSTASTRLLVFFYTLCSHCLTELATVSQVQATLTQDHSERTAGIVPLYIDSPAESPAIADAYVTRVGIDAPVLLDRDAQVASRYGIAYYPTLVLVDHGGIVRGVWTGEPSATTLASAIRQAGG